MTDLSAPVRARIGMIIPSSNRMAEPHFWRYAPTGVVPHVTRLRMTGPYRMPLTELYPRIGAAAAMLADAGCDPVLFHCTANSMAEGVAAERGIVEAVEAATGGRATTTASATMAALAALGAKRIVLVSPYQRESHEHELEFLVEAGIEVVGERNLALAGSDAYCGAPPELWRDTLLDMRSDRADAYFVSCANVRAIEALDEMEARLGRPVITSNQVALWHALRLAGIGDAVPGIGRLMSEPAPSASAPA